MTSKRNLMRILVLAAAIAAMLILPAGAARAATYYWDNNGDAAGFGTAAGTWAEPTIGDATQGWSTSNSGVLLPVDVTTLSTSNTVDAVNFGNGATGLGAGTITVDGTVQSGNIIFAAGSGSIVLSGGTINLTSGATGPNLTVNNASAPSTISSDLTGGLSTSRVTKNGGGTLYLSGTNSYASGTVVGSGVLVLNSANALAAGGITFSGGIIGLGEYGDFTRPIGATSNWAKPGCVHWRSHGGFAAYGADRNVNIGGAGGFVGYGSGNVGGVVGTMNGKTLILGAADSTHKLIWVNGLDVGGATRTLQVNDGLAAVDAEISGVIRGATDKGLNKTGTGTVVFSNLNTITGPLNVNAGTLIGTVSTVDGSATAFGNATLSTRAITLGSDATLRFDVANIMTPNFAQSVLPALVLNGGTALNNVAGNNALGNVTLAGGTLTATTGHADYGAFNLNGTITSTGDSVISTSDATNGKMMLNSSGANNVETPSTFDVQDGTLTVSAPLAGVTLESKISGLTKIGAGALVLSGENTYTGATAVSAGTLALSGSGSSNTSSGIAVNGADAKLVQASSVAVSPTVTLTQGTVTGSGTINTVVVGAGTGGVVSNNDGVAGAALTVGSLTFQGAATVNTFSGSTSAVIVATSLDSNSAGTVTINPSAASWTSGATYDLIGYGGGSIGGAGFSQFVLGTVGGMTDRQVATVALTDTGTAVAMMVPVYDNPYWVGDGDAKWNLASTNNWKLVTAGTYTTFMATDDVLFDDNATGTGPINVDIDTANVAPSSTTFNNGAKDYVLASSGGYGISSGNLTKSGDGTVTISSVNTYAGPTNINGGVIVTSGSGTLGTGSALNLGGGRLDLGGTSQTVGAVSVTAAAAGGDTISNGSLTGTSYEVSNETGTAVISANLLGTGALAKSGAGTATLSGVNAYTGATTVNAGALQLDGSLDAGSTVAIGTGGTLSGSGTVNGSATITGDGVIDFASTGRIAGTLGVTGGNWNGEGSVGNKITTTSGEFTVPTGATLNVGDTVADNNRSLELQGSSTVRVEGTLNVDPETMVAVRDAGTLIVTGTVNTSGRWIPVASNSTSPWTARIIVEGSGQWNHTHGTVNCVDFVIGESGNVRGELIIRDSAQVNSSFMRMATWGATTWGVVIQDGGTLTLAPTMADYIDWQEPALGMAYNGQAEYYLNGGVLNCGVIATPAEFWGSSTGQGRFYFNGGTLVPNTDDFVPNSTAALLVGQSSYMQNLTQVVVQAGGAIIDTDGHKITIAQNLEHDPNASAPAVDGGLTKLGAGTLILKGSVASTYTGPTAVNAGTLVARNATALGVGSAANVSVASGADLEYRAAADSPLAIGGTLTVNGGAGTTIGASVGSTATSAAINVAGDATITNGAHVVNIYALPAIAHATGLVTLVHSDGAGSSLNPTTAPTLGVVYNNTDFTVGGFVRSATDLQVNIVSATPLAGAYWTGGLAGNANVWGVSDGTTASNWVTTAAGGATALVPGPATNVVISANSVATAPTATVLGTDMTIKSLTISDTANGLGLNGDDFVLTIAPASSTAGITMSAGVPASNIAANLALGADQTWTNNSASALTVSGSISGAFGLTKGGTGEVILGSANTYSGDTTISAGTLTLANRYAVQNSTVIMGGGSAAVVFDSSVTANAFTFGGLAGSGSGAGYDIALQNNDPNTPAGINLTVGGNDASTTYAGSLSGAGRLTKAGAGTLTLSNAASTYAGVTNISAGTLEVSKLADGGASSSIGASSNTSTDLLIGNNATLRYTGAGDSTDRLFRFNGNLGGLSITLDASGTGPIYFTNTGSPTHSNTNQARTLNLIGSNTGENTLAASIGNNGNQALSVVKDGPGMWALSGDNTYTGTTTVNAGTLLVNNSTGSGTGTGAVTVNFGGTLGGYGIIGGAVTVNSGGTVAPGESAGTLTATGNVAMEDGSIYEWQLAAKTGTAGTNWDLITADSINLTGLITFKVDNSLFSGSIAATDGPFVVASTTTGTITNSATFNFVLPGGWTGGSLALSGDSKELILSGMSSIIPGDTNGDQVVDAADFITLKKNFGTSTGAGVSAGDFNTSGTVDWADLNILTNNMGTTGGAPAMTPEPATLGLLAIGALAVLRRRRMA